MKKIILYEYDKRNREDFLKQLEDVGYAFLSIMVGEDIKNVFGEITTATKGFIMDVTPFLEMMRGVYHSHLLLKKSLKICKTIGRYFLL